MVIRLSLGSPCFFAFFISDERFENLTALLLYEIEKFERKMLQKAIRDGIIIYSSSWVADAERRFIMGNGIHGERVPATRVYCVEDIAEILNISRGSAYELIKEGHFNTVRIGSAIRISKRSFDEWLDSQNSNEQEI